MQPNVLGFVSVCMIFGLRYLHLNFTKTDSNFIQRDRRQFSFLILSGSKLINQTNEVQKFINSLDIRSEIWRESLNNSDR